MWHQLLSNGNIWVVSDDSQYDYIYLLKMIVDWFLSSRPMWHQLGPPVRRQSPVRALCSVIAMLLLSMLTNFMIYF